MVSLIHSLETSGAAFISSIEHAAAWLIGTLATAETSLHALEASSPLVAKAIAAGEASAAAHGLPMVAIADAGEAVLMAARALAARLAAPAPAAKAVV